MIASTVNRVRESTADHVNDQIRRQAEQDVERVAAEGPRAIERRLAELDREWDTERTLETNFATVVLIGTGLGLTVDRRWHLLTAVAAGFMIQHALQGWCPPLPVFRRLGFRTATEIERERYALKARRGDFRQAASGTDEAFQAVRS